MNLKILCTKNFPSSGRLPSPVSRLPSPVSRLSFVVVVLFACSMSVHSTFAATTKLNSSSIFGPTTGLVGHWTFDGKNMTNATATDISGNGNNGTLTNGPLRTIGKIGQGLRFDGVDDNVNAGSAASLDDLPALTASVWIKPNSFGEGNFGKIIGKNANVSTAGAWQLSLITGSPCINGGTPTQTNSMFFTKAGSAGTSRSSRCAADNVVTLGVWQHFVVTWDGSAGYNNTGIKMYKNGVEVSYVITNTGGIDSAASDAALDLIIGNRPAGDRTFDGSIDDVRLYNRVLSATEIRSLATLGKATIKPTLSTAKIKSFSCGVSTVKDADNNIYNTLQVGSQCWMKQNMRVGTRVNIATTQTNNSTIEKWCYSDTASNCTSNNPNQPDGGLYQWNEAMQYSTTPGARGICPLGWHIPTHDQLTTLERNVCTTGSCTADFPYDTTTTGYRGTTEGTKLKPSGSSGFEGNFAGYGDSGNWANRGAGGVWWSSSPSGANAWYRDVYSSAQVGRGAIVKSYGLSVRCLKD